MHPHVKHHLHRLTTVLLVLMMIFLPMSVSDSCSNFPSVRHFKIYSSAKGYVRVGMRGKVVATECKNCSGSENLYKVTIKQHYILLYHIHTRKFICWNPKHRKLISRRSLSNITHCLFEEKASVLHPWDRVRYTTTDKFGHEAEMWFAKKGGPVKKMRTCRMKYNVPETNELQTEQSDHQMRERYKKLHKCVITDFLPFDVDCDNHHRKFCDFMYQDCHNGHVIVAEIKEFCKKDWKERKLASKCK